MSVIIETYEARGLTRWRASVALSIEGRFRRDRRQGFPDEKSARSWARRAELRILEGQAPERPPARERKKRAPSMKPEGDPSQWTLDRVFEECEIYWLRRKAPTTVNAYLSRYRTHVKPYFGRMVFANLDSAALRRIAQGPAAVVFSSIMKTAGKVGAHLPAGIWDPPPVRQGGRVDFLEIAELKAVLAELAPVDRAVCTVLVGTGARLQEVFGLRWQSLDFPRRLVHIESQLCSQTHRLRPPKSKKSRVVPMSSAVHDAFLTLPQGKPGDFIFSFSGGTFRKRLDAAAKRAGLKRKIVPHLLRHTAASLAVQSGVALEVVGEILGHSSVAITGKYAHLRPEHLAAGVAAVDAAINS